MSMSMPMTCTKQSKSVKEDMSATHIPMLIPRILMSVNDKHTFSFCQMSIENISQEFKIPKSNIAIAHMQQLISSQTMSFTDSLALFFLLLNIDTQLKNSMIRSESEAGKSKLCNFFMNLRRHIIPEFMTDASSTSTIFVTKCTDAWTVA